MTSRERMKIALTGGIPDRVPFAPDISTMIPCKLTGKNFYEVLADGNPPLWKAYLEALDYFGCDGWLVHGYITPIFKKNELSIKTERYLDDDSRLNIVKIYDTPKGQVRERILYPPQDAESVAEKLIKNLKEDLPKIKYIFPDIIGTDVTSYRQQKEMLGEKGMLCIGVFPAGFHMLVNYFEGNLQGLTYAYYDYPDLLEEFMDIYETQAMQYLEFVLDEKPDSILTGGSGCITLASPELFDQYTLPGLKRITKLCKQAGVISGVHSCGKELHVIERCANQTDLNYINPIEIAPMGDCVLSDVKKLYGKKLALMGNLHTTDIMLKGTVEDVIRESKRAIDDAADGGGFVLSTGDQCGRDTPHENIRAMLEVCKIYGKYPR